MFTTKNRVCGGDVCTQVDSVPNQAATTPGSFDGGIPSVIIVSGFGVMSFFTPVAVVSTLALGLDSDSTISFAVSGLGMLSSVVVFEDVVSDVNVPFFATVASLHFSPFSLISKTSGWSGSQGNIFFEDPPAPMVIEIRLQPFPTKAALDFFKYMEWR